MGDEEDNFFPDDGGGATYESNPEPGCGQKLQGAVCSFCLGIVLFPLSLYLLGWNEKNFVCTQKQIYFAETNAQAWPCGTVAAPTTLPEDELYQFSCPFDQSSFKEYTASFFNPIVLTTSYAGLGPLFDSFRFSGLGAKQHAEIYACIETEHQRTTGSGQQRRTVTTYSYSIDWTQSPAAFHTVLTGQNLADATAACGAVQLQTEWTPPFPAFIDDGDNTDFADDVTAATIRLPGSWIHEIPVQEIVTSTLLLTPPPASAVPVQDWRVDLGTVVGATLTNCAAVPVLGCVRLSYKTTAATQASVISVVGPGKLAAPEVTPVDWLCAEDTYYAFYPSTSAMTLEQMIAAQHSENSVQAWIIRVAGLMMAWAAVFCCFSPVTFAADVLGDCLNFIPCVGGIMEDVVEGMVNAVVCVLSCSIGCSSGLCVIAIVMIVMRPLVGGLLFLVVGCILAGACAFSHSAPKNEKRGGEEMELIENES